MARQVARHVAAREGVQMWCAELEGRAECVPAADSPEAANTTGTPCSRAQPVVGAVCSACGTERAPRAERGRALVAAAAPRAQPASTPAGAPQHSTAGPSSPRAQRGHELVAHRHDEVVAGIVPAAVAGGFGGLCEQAARRQLGRVPEGCREGGRGASRVSGAVLLLMKMQGLGARVCACEQACSGGGGPRLPPG